MQLNSFSIRLYKVLTERKVILIYIPLIIYWIILFIATTIPTDKIPQLFDAQDKAEHFIAYCILGMLLFFALNFQKKSSLLAANPFISTVFILLIYAAADELHQLLIPGRQCDLVDWFSDGIGGILGIGFAYLVTKLGNSAIMESI
jgi:VanZ family protein